MIYTHIRNMTRIFKCRSRCNIIQTRLKGDKGENTSWSQKAVPPPGSPRVCACAVRAARSAPRPHPAPRPDDRSLLTLGLKAKVPRECPRGTGLCGGVTRARPRPHGTSREWRGLASVTATVWHISALDGRGPRGHCLPPPCRGRSWLTATLARSEQVAPANVPLSVSTCTRPLPGPRGPCAHSVPAFRLPEGRS